MAIIDPQHFQQSPRSNTVSSFPSHSGHGHEHSEEAEGQTGSEIEFDGIAVSVDKADIRKTVC